MVRYAFTMIELIFALVIMGIVFITLPLILINDSTNIEQNLMQEAIFASSAKLGQILTYPWDENSPDPDPGTVWTASDVVRATAGHADLNRVGTSDFRVGHLEQPLHRRMTPNTAERSASAVLGPDAGDLDDIDDFNGADPLISTTSAGGYKKAYRITTTVSYLSDAVNYATNDINFTFDVTAVVTNPSNIKMIEITTDQNNSDGWSALPILRLRTFSANIGETDFYKRTY